MANITQMCLLQEAASALLPPFSGLLHESTERLVFQCALVPVSGWHALINFSRSRHLLLGFNPSLRHPQRSCLRPPILRLSTCKLEEMMTLISLGTLWRTSRLWWSNLPTRSPFSPLGPLLSTNLCANRKKKTNEQTNSSFYPKEKSFFSSLPRNHPTTLRGH